MALTYGDLGKVIWEKTREDDRLAFEVLRYFHTKGNDKAYVCMLDHFHFNELADGAYHCLCGLDFLEPYIDNEGCECARLTELGLGALNRIRGDFQ